MTISLVADLFRGTRRIRLLFSGPLASGAFTTPSMYSVSGAPGTPAPITVVALFAFATNPNAVELAVDCDWVPGALYEIDCAAVPGTDASTFTGSIQDRVAESSTLAPPNAEPETNDLDLLLYGRDILWNGQDFVDDATGDLQLIAGRSNWQSAMTRRMISSGLTWDVAYGAKAYTGVDAPSVLQPALAGQFLAQARADDRTLRASIDYSEDPSGTASFVLYIIGRDGLEQIAVPAHIPVGTLY